MSDITNALGEYESLIGENVEMYFSNVSNSVEVSVPSGSKIKKGTIKRIEKDLGLKFSCVRKDDEDTYSFIIRYNDVFIQAIEKYNKGNK